MVEILTKITAILTTVVITIAGWLGFQQPVQAPLGATIPKVVAVFETSLASKITSSATSMTLVSGTDKAGNPLSGYICFVLDEGTASEEFVCGTASSTSVTGMIRGIDPVDGDLEVASLKKEHRRGASVKVTNYPQLAILSRILNGDETLPNALEYATSVSTSTLAGNNQYLASVDYVNSVSYSGAPDADEDTKGIVEQATRSELGSGVSSGDTSAPLFVPNQYFSTSSSATTSVVVTKSNGKINQNFWDLTEDFTWSGEHTFNGTTTLATTTINYITFDEKGFYDFGDGSDGDVTISSTTTLTEDMYYNNLTVNSGVALNTGGYRIYVKDTLTVNGVIRNNGSDGDDGGNGTGDAGGSGGSGGAGGAGGTLSAGSNGGDGGNGGYCTSQGCKSNGGAGDAGINKDPSLGSDGVTGGNGGGTQNSNGGTAGSAGTATVEYLDIAYLIPYIQAIDKA